jgi:hypothetical protein
MKMNAINNTQTVAAIEEIKPEDLSIAFNFRRSMRVSE